MSRATMIEGIATILWGSAWADHVEERRCANLSGCKIEEVMPEIPKEAREQAEALASEYEKLNGCTLEALYQRALDADGLTVRKFPALLDGPERFGECLAWEAMGAGVGWDNDHAEYPHECPHIETCDLMFLAESTCDECQAKRRTYTVLSLDMWGHVGADCISFGCPCVDTREERGPYHDDERCQCAEECNNQHKVGVIDTRDDSDTAILDALLEGGFLSDKGREECEIDDASDGTMLDVNDQDGRRIFALQLEGEG
jgi:hypothetical protein